MSSLTTHPLPLTSTRALSNGTAGYPTMGPSIPFSHDRAREEAEQTKKIAMIVGLGVFLPLLLIVLAWIARPCITTRERIADISLTPHPQHPSDSTGDQGRRGPIHLRTLRSDDPYANDDDADTIASSDLAPPPYSKQPQPPGYTSPSLPPAPPLSTQVHSLSLNPPPPSPQADTVDSSPSEHRLAAQTVVSGP